MVYCVWEFHLKCVCIYVLAILTHSSHLYDLLVFSTRVGMLSWPSCSVANYILSTYISVKFHLDFVPVVYLNSNAYILGNL